MLRGGVEYPLDVSQRVVPDRVAVEATVVVVRVEPVGDFGDRADPYVRRTEQIVNRRTGDMFHEFRGRAFGVFGDLDVLDENIDLWRATGSLRCPRDQIYGAVEAARGPLDLVVVAIAQGASQPGDTDPIGGRGGKAQNSIAVPSDQQCTGS